MDIEIRMTGDKRVQAILETMPRRMLDSCVRAGLRAGARIIRKEARMRAPRKRGALRKGIKTRMRKIQQGYRDVEVRSTAPHSHLLEFGTNKRYYVSKRTGRKHYTGFIPKDGRFAFMRPAFDARHEDAKKAFQTRVAQWLRDKGWLRALRGIESL